MKKKYYWFVGIVFIFILIFSFLWLYFSPKIPEPYKNPKYCDENVDCDFYSIGGIVFCGNMYYVNQSNIIGGATDIECFCNTTSNECIIQSLRIK